MKTFRSTLSFILIGSFYLYFATACDYSVTIGTECIIDGDSCESYGTTCVDGICTFEYAYDENQVSQCSCTYSDECGGYPYDCIDGNCYETQLKMGSPCFYNQQCGSNVCNSTTGVCQGAALGEYCFYAGGCADPEAVCSYECQYPEPAGSQCYSNTECESGLICGYNGAWPVVRTCQDPKPIGTPCYDSYECAANTTCRNSTGQFSSNWTELFCNTFLPVGAACTVSRSYPFESGCVNGSGCNNEICTLFNSIGIGSPCSDSTFCSSGLCGAFYDGTYSKTSVCLQNATGFLSDGTYCDPQYPFMCQNGYCGCREWNELSYKCLEATCGEPQGKGDECNYGDMKCAPGLTCSTKNKCIELFSGKEGDSCDRHSDCDMCLYCNGDYKCASHSGSNCYTDVNIQDDTDYTLCENGEYCDCGKTCKKVDDMYWYTKLGDTNCKNAGQWRYIMWSYFCEATLGDMNYGLQGFTGNITDIAPVCQKLLASAHCCEYYEKAFLDQYRDPESFANARISFPYTLSITPFQFDCQNLVCSFCIEADCQEIIQVEFEPVCCDETNLADCPYWGDTLFLNTKVLFNPLFNVNSANFSTIVTVQTEYKSWDCKDFPWLELIIGLVVGIGGAAILAGVGAVIYMRYKKKQQHTPLADHADS